MGKLNVTSPISPVPHPSGEPSGKCIDNGEPGLAGRTSSPNALNEVTYDQNAPLPGPKGK